MSAFLKDLKHSARMLLHAPNFTIAAIATLALGIAANTAMFSVVNTVLLKPFAYRDPKRIVMFQNNFRAGLRTGRWNLIGGGSTPALCNTLRPTLSMLRI